MSCMVPPLRNISKQIGTIFSGFFKNCCKSAKRRGVNFQQFLSTRWTQHAVDMTRVFLETIKIFVGDFRNIVQIWRKEFLVVFQSLNFVGKLLELRLMEVNYTTSLSTERNLRLSCANKKTTVRRVFHEWNEGLCTIFKMILLRSMRCMNWNCIYIFSNLEFENFVKWIRDLSSKSVASHVTNNQLSQSLNQALDLIKNK